MQHEVVELGVVRPVVEPEVVVELGRLDERPDLGADGGQLGRVERGDLRVLSVDRISLLARKARLDAEIADKPDAVTILIGTNDVGDKVDA